MKLFGACYSLELRLKATHFIYQKLSRAAIAEFCNSSRTMDYLYDFIGLIDLLFICFPRKLPLLTSEKPVPPLKGLRSLANTTQGHTTPTCVRAAQVGVVCPRLHYSTPPGLDRSNFRSLQFLTVSELIP